MEKGGLEKGEREWKGEKKSCWWKVIGKVGWRVREIRRIGSGCMGRVKGNIYNKVENRELKELEVMMWGRMR